MYNYSSTSVDNNGPTDGDWTGDNGNGSTYTVIDTCDHTIIVVNHPADTGRQRMQEARRQLNLDEVKINRALATHDAHLDMAEWLRLTFSDERQRPLPRGRTVPCAEQRRCPARNPLARVSRAPIVAYRADVR